MDTKHPKNIGHRWGGQIVAVHGYGHTLGKLPRGAQRSSDDWYIDCTVKWGDTGEESRTKLHPSMLVGDAENQELTAVLRGMTDYLNEHGSWTANGWSAYRAPKRSAA